MCDPQVAPLVANSSLIVALFNLLGDKQEDDEIVLQVLLCSTVRELGLGLDRRQS